MAQLELVVAVGGEDQDGCGVGLPRQQPQDVEGGLVGPMQVLEHEDGRRAAHELAQQRRRHLVRPRAALRDVREIATGVLGDVEQRAQGARREQRVAGAPEDPCRSPMLVGEPARKRRLPGTRLARDEHEMPAGGRADFLQHRLQRVELRRALQEVARLREPDRRCC
jgi:hypothetical protein